MTEVALDFRCRLGEGPVWDDRSEELLFVDILAGEVHRFAPASGAHTVHATGEPVGAAVPRAGTGLALAVRDGFATFDPATGKLERIATIDRAPGEQRMNDGKADPQGRLWAGTQSDDGAGRAGALYRLDPDGRARRVLGQIGISNGMGWDADGTTMYYVDTATGGVDAFAFDPETGDLTDRRRLIDIDRGVPDGMTLDADGCLWVALFDGGAVHRYTPDGRLDAVVELPVSLVTSCAFGGPALDVLFITTASHRLRGPDPLAGALFGHVPGVKGVLADRFAG